MMKIAGGKTEQGVVIGNTFDKYGSRNPVVRWLMRGFDDALSALVAKASPATIHEVGCGEGYWIFQWLAQGHNARGSDFSESVIAMARENAAARGVDPERFQVRDVYELDPAQDSADLVVCCEVLEHLDDPERALRALQRLDFTDLIISVPREPLWRTLNMARGKYLGDLGNTPGHLQNWSKPGITKLVGRYFDVAEVVSPLPWTMIHCRPATP